jgi:hypothetical protein
VRIRDLPLISQCYYRIDCGWDSLYENWMTDHRGCRVELQPDFQRDYVWTERQQIDYIENMLKGSLSGRDVWFNHPRWGSFSNFTDDPIVCVDGQQRIGAIKGFLDNKFKVFEKYLFSDFEDWDTPIYDRTYVVVHVNNLKTSQQVYQWYLDLNSGGTIHTKEDLDKVRSLLKRSDK